MGMLVLIFSLCRIVFYIRNSGYFPEAGASEFFVGMWFDWITTCLMFFPIILIELFPNKNRKAKWFKWPLAVVTAIIFFLGIAINLIDIEYFSFTSARSTDSLFVMLSFGSDLQDQMPSYFRDYWWIGLLIILFIVGALFLLKKIYKSEDDSASTPIWKQIVILIIVGGLAVFFGRGGFVHKPIKPTEASKYTEPSNVQLVLNTAYTIMHSWGTATLEEKRYMSNEEALELFNPIHNYSTTQRINGQNVCVIILESFSIEFINSLNMDEEDFAPFFDELVDSSLVYPWGFANGKKSIDAVPSIISSVPKFMTDEYMLSKYANNSVESLPEKLNEMGYSTAFYHGATNGSMNFDAYCAMAGFDEYYGRTEYDNDDHFDGTWGIWDEEFLDWTVDRMGEMKAPFFSTVFTISSHPPYVLPEKYEKMFEDAPSDIHKVIQYTDLALRHFFDKARTEPWFDSTLFIITADHTPGSRRLIYLHDRGKMNVPLIFYHPTDTFFRGRDERILSHIDIMPTVLDLVGYQDDFFSFGHSAFDTVPGFTFSDIANKKMFFEHTGIHPHLLIYQRDQAVAMYHFLDRDMIQNMIYDKPPVVASMERRLRAIIQIYNHCLIHNQMTVDRFSY